MAVDSREKRASLVALGLRAGVCYPLPDGLLADLPDRLHLAGLYRGLTEDAASDSTGYRVGQTFGASPRQYRRSAAVRGG